MFSRLGRKKIPVPSEVKAVCRALRDNGFQVYLVGGAVRDALRGQSSPDWDLATDAHPDQVSELFPQSIEVGKQFGTITITEGSLNIELTTFRKETGYADRRHPDAVVFTSSIREDLARRDFTVNAIAYDPFTHRYVDPYGGRKDLRRQILRCVGDPAERFAEDALRMLRLYRFAATLEFKIDRATQKAVQPNLINAVSAERIAVEMSKLLLAVKPSRGLLPMHQSGLLTVLLPELTECEGVEQGSFHKYDVFHHCIYTADAARPKLALRWAALLHDIGKPQARFVDEKGVHFYGHEEIGAELTTRILTRLRYPKKIIAKAAKLVREHMFYLGSQPSDRALRRLIARVGREDVMDLIDLRRADIVAMRSDYARFWPAWKNLHDRVQELLENPVQKRELALTGHDVMEILEIPPGPEVGKALDWLLKQVLDNPDLNERTTLKQLLQDKYVPSPDEECSHCDKLEN